MIARHLLIHGRVQGVGYRYAFEHMARRYGLVGWVRNRSDGTVEAFIEGEDDSVEAMAAWSRQGPPTAAVSRVDAQNLPLEGHTGFSRKPTL